MFEESIAAIATAYGTAAIAMIRISGPDAISRFSTVFKGRDLSTAKSHSVHFGHIMAEDGSIIDDVLATVMYGPKTFTGEDTVEVSTHGGVLVTRRVLERILSTGIRLANPGEFSERAFLNGKIDLVQAESIMDMIHARSEKALKIATLGLHKHTTELIRSLRDRLIGIIAAIEVNIDYPEYDDAIVMGHSIIRPDVMTLINDMDVLLMESRKNRMIRDGVKTVIIGKPNVGKSSLLNALIDEDKAIVTDIPGTTRDMVEAILDIRGVTLNLIDTAGIRQTEDTVEKIGVSKSKKAIEEAELVLLVLDQSKAMTEEDEALLALTSQKRRLVILNKADLPPALSLEETVRISSLNKTGLRTLEDAILRVLELSDIDHRDLNYLANQRQIDHVVKARQALTDALDSIDHEMPVDLYVTDLSSAWRMLGEILGETPDDALLDELFSRFCLGK
ncbi:MAG: tRNA uridine-5-carboxymethylaminomethyl(34) synthesis GTPase MnmE [Acholeplasmataceae bacterium]|nr:tRNA uridine-5-carboxymethylaminomethyl(34) synthesis GTPase MnmE [Acholeplasmataceae bacterium]